MSVVDPSSLFGPAVATTPIPLPVAPPAPNLAIRTSQQAIQRLDPYAFEPTDDGSLMAVADRIWRSGLFGNEKTTVEQVYVVLVKGRELGWTVNQSLERLYIVGPRVAMYTSTMVAMVLQSPDCEVFEVRESTPQKCTVAFKRRGMTAERLVTWTIEMAAHLANDLKRLPWKQTPWLMLKYRAQSEAAKEGWPHVTNGMSSAEELRDMDLIEIGPGAPTRTPEVRLPGNALNVPTPVAAVPVQREPRPTASENVVDVQTTPIVAAPIGSVEPPKAATAPVPAPSSPSPAPVQEEIPILSTWDGARRALGVQIGQATGPALISAAAKALGDAYREKLINDDELPTGFETLLARCQDVTERNLVGGLIKELRDATLLSDPLIKQLRATVQKVNEAVKASAK